MALIKDTLKAFDDLKTKHQSVWCNAFWYVKVCKYISESVFNTLYIDRTKILKKLLSDKINGTKNALIFLSRAPTHHSFTFNLRFLYKLKHKVRLSETVCGNFHFRFRSIFMWKFIFFLNKMLGLFDFKMS